VSFDIRQLRYAVAAADHGSFYRAARALEIEQSTLSRNISKLERVVGTKLFDRTRAGVALTVAGTRFVRSARAMVINADRMLGESRLVGRGQAGSLVLGLNSSVSAGNLRATMFGWARDNPEVDLDGVEADRGALLAGLNTGEIDIAILMGARLHNGFRFEPFWSERVHAALPSAHALAERDIIHWTDLRAEQFYLPAADPGTEVRDLLLGRLAQSGITPDIEMQRCSREAILSLLGESAALSIVCEGAIGVRYPDVVYRPIHGEQGQAHVDYAGYWRDDNRNPTLRRFLEFMKSRHALQFEIPYPTT
jgi:DNA-binding transcriptional LysR family regulator